MITTHMFEGRSLSQATSKPKVIISVSVPPAQPQLDNREQLILLIAVQCSVGNEFAGPEFGKILPLPKSVCGCFHVVPAVAVVWGTGGGGLTMISGGVKRRQIKLSHCCPLLKAVLAQQPLKSLLGSQWDLHS